jgi:hypothetical protein
VGFREDTGDMDRGRAETHLRQLAEAELRRATEPGVLGRGPAGMTPQALARLHGVWARRVVRPAWASPATASPSRLPSACRNDG